MMDDLPEVLSRLRAWVDSVNDEGRRVAAARPGERYVLHGLAFAADVALRQVEQGVASGDAARAALGMYDVMALVAEMNPAIRRIGNSRIEAVERDQRIKDAVDKLKLSGWRAGRAQEHVADAEGVSVALVKQACRRKTTDILPEPYLAHPQKRDQATPSNRSSRDDRPSKRTGSHAPRRHEANPTP